MGARLGECGIGLGFGHGISAGSEEWNDLLLGWSSVLALVRQGSATRDVDRQRNGLNRSHGAVEAVPREFQRGEAVVVARAKDQQWR